MLAGVFHLLPKEALPVEITIEPLRQLTKPTPSLLPVERVRNSEILRVVERTQQLP